MRRYSAKETYIIEETYIIANTHKHNIEETCIITNTTSKRPTSVFGVSFPQ